MNIEDLPDDSDTSDEDYVPTGKEDIPSEIDSDEELEEIPSDSETGVKKGQKRKRKSKVKKKFKKDSQQAVTTKVEEQAELKEKENDKKNVDDIWADFMKDTGFKPKNSKTDCSSNSSKLQESQEKLVKVKDIFDAQKGQSQQKSTEKVKITQIFDFAGEEVKVEKTVAADSAEARLMSNALDGAPKTSRGRKGGGLSGISNVLSQLGKKPKISTLEKSKLDWDKFKKEENIEEELQTYNKGKDGFLDRQDFLQRADLRRFEIEKDIRTVERNKRFNSTL